MANYRPVSNVSFVSKLVERAVAIRLHSYLSSNDQLPSCQSTEPAMLSVWSNIPMAADQHQVTLLALLDMSSAFDCMDHDLLLQRLQTDFGLSNAPLVWIRSFLSDRTYQIAYVGDLSHTYLLWYGVPQGSVLGPPLLCSLHSRGVSRGGASRYALTSVCR